MENCSVGGGALDSFTCVVASVPPQRFGLNRCQAPTPPAFLFGLIFSSFGNLSTSLAVLHPVDGNQGRGLGRLLLEPEKLW